VIFLYYVILLFCYAVLGSFCREQRLFDFSYRVS